MHLEHYNRPKLQIRVIRILWMVPIYAVDSWLSLRFKEARFYIDPVRECYEAYVIYNFFMYLVAYLEDAYGDINVYYSTKDQRHPGETRCALLRLGEVLRIAVFLPTKGQVEHLWPANYLLQPWAMGEDFFWETKKGVLAYVIARPLMTLVSVVCNLFGVYGDGEFRGDRAYPYVAFVNNCTQMLALYCLVLLYHATYVELAPIRPLSKFIVIKAVVFFSYWQSVALAIMAKLGLIRSADWSTYDADDVAAGLQNFLICVEMFLAAVMHAHAFPPRDYMDPSRPPPGFFKNVKVMFDVTDVVSDVQGVVTDTVQQTTDRLQDVGQRTWTTARDTGKVLVTKPLHPLMSLFGKPPKRKHTGDEDVDSDVESREGQQALLEYSHRLHPHSGGSSSLREAS
ncbi:hypothetical protein N2152v2_010848 [Parachlorella kessleri]